ncbi:hypothetical protein BR93DRAFT_825192 [Coniochaeta sp. PMI_546]|nr:hypothetical protein BR93DRAFT_825192 [Coniochaeta sp. PMI_546]
MPYEDVLWSIGNKMHSCLPSLWPIGLLSHLRIPLYPPPSRSVQSISINTNFISRLLPPHPPPYSPTSPSTADTARTPSSAAAAGCRRAYTDCPGTSSPRLLGCHNSTASWLPSIGRRRRICKSGVRTFFLFSCPGGFPVPSSWAFLGRLFASVILLLLLLVGGGGGELPEKGSTLLETVLVLGR